jgi:CMP-N,N'-diacetyllegionaminic acid synthase
MFKGKTFLGVIPARIGSKRLPNKNILPLGNKSLVEWTIDAAVKSSFIDAVVVTSDSQKILELTEKKKVKAINRPKNLADDKASTIDVIKHTLESIDTEYDFFVLLQPTSPLRHAKHIDEAIKKIILKKAFSIVSVSECEHPPLWSNTIPEGGSMAGFLDSHYKGYRSQDFDTFYRLNGAIYIVNIEDFKDDNSLLNDNSFSYIMPQQDSIDIDTEFDYLIAQAIIKNNKVEPN